MSRLIKLTLASLAFVFIAAALPAHADPVVVNGDFSTFVPSNATGGGWTSTNIDFAGGHTFSAGNPGGNFVLNGGGNLATDPTISQTVSGFTIGQTYTLTGDFAIHVRLSGATPGFGVDVGGVNVLQLDAPVDGSFTNFSYTFTALATDIQIRFRGDINGTDNSFRIDNIAFIQVGGPPPSAVPEPATMLLLGTGLAGVAVKARRQRKARGADAGRS